jgi:hypothetical protein
MFGIRKIIELLLSERPKMNHTFVIPFVITLEYGKCTFMCELVPLRLCADIYSPNKVGGPIDYRTALAAWQIVNYRTT